VGSVLPELEGAPALAVEHAVARARSGREKRSFEITGVLGLEGRHLRRAPQYRERVGTG